MDETGRAQEVLDFWFGRPGDPDYESGRKIWFRSTRGFDDEIRARFLADYEAAFAGARDSWVDEARSCLALVVVLDQFPRNMFRDTPRAFAADGKALSVARHAVGRGLDAALRPVERGFVYLPFEHSEDIDHQRRCVALTAALDASAHDFALRHMRIIERFGRFPHRNRILGRVSTAEELAFLAEPGSSFLRAPEK